MNTRAFVVVVEDSPLMLARVVQGLARTVSRLRSIASTPIPGTRLARVCVIVDDADACALIVRRLERIVAVQRLWELPLRPDVHDEIRLVSVLARDRPDCSDLSAAQLEAVLATLETDGSLGAYAPALQAAVHGGRDGSAG